MKKSLLPFVCGVMVTLVGVGTAAATTGFVGELRFNTANFVINHETVFASGENLTTEAGAEIPASIFYVDENGGGTNYLPLRAITQELGLPVEWKNGTVYMEVDGELAVSLLPVQEVGAVYDDYIQMVEAIEAEDGVELLSEEHAGVENFSSELKLRRNKGNTVSVTVTNEGSAPLVFSLGMKKENTKILDGTQVPAGETVTRTFQIIGEAKDGAVPYIDIGNARDTFRNHRFTVTAVQFDAEEVQMDDGSVLIEVGGDGAGLNASMR